MKLTDEQIKQALEFCANCECNSEKTEKECALINMSFCKNYLRKQSLDYINRLEAENRRLQAKIKEFDEKLVIQRGLIDRQKAEIERLEYTILEEHSECDRLSLHVSNLLYELENTKAEVIKEYREKAAIKLAQNARSDYWHWIDDTLYEVEKEMVGEE